MGAISKSESYIVEYDLLDEELESYFGTSGYTLAGDSSSEYTVTINSIKYSVSVSGQTVETISTTTSYVGCYADIDADGTVDGIIYVDLLANKETSGQWADDYGNWGITKISESDSQDYYVKATSSTDEFGSKEVIAPVSTTSTKSERFYVMALEDFEKNGYTTFYWYYQAGIDESLDEKYNISYSTNDFGEGMTNTERMITAWNEKKYGDQNARDIWGLIQDEYEEGWFIPSKSEWAVYGSAFDITTTNYVKLGLSEWYWTSSQSAALYAFFVWSGSGLNNTTAVSAKGSFRLSRTF